ncbi:MAG: hypothetical protein GXO84_07600 [Chlorobi bacterium]|nr:hypothetical protein [Chlorobiota bacterium]
MTKEELVGTIAFVVCAMATFTLLQGYNVVLKAIASVVAGGIGSIIVRVFM